MMIDNRCIVTPVAVILAALIIDKRRGSTSSNRRFVVAEVIVNELDELLERIEDIMNR
jgi:hypothetical protein